MPQMYGKGKVRMRYYHLIKKCKSTEFLKWKHTLKFSQVLSDKKMRK